MKVEVRPVKVYQNLAWLTQSFPLCNPVMAVSHHFSEGGKSRSRVGFHSGPVKGAPPTDVENEGPTDLRSMGLFVQLSHPTCRNPPISS